MTAVSSLTTLRKPKHFDCDTMAAGMAALRLRRKMEVCRLTSPVLAQVNNKAMPHDGVRESTAVSGPRSMCQIIRVTCLQEQKRKIGDDLMADIMKQTQAAVADFKSNLESFALHITAVAIRSDQSFALHPRHVLPHRRRPAGLEQICC